MSKNELVAKIKALNEWEALMEEAKAEAEALRDSIKAEMLAQETEETMTNEIYIPNIFWAYYDLYRRRIITLEAFSEKTNLSIEELTFYLEQI